MHAVILAGGRGTRLQPLTDTRPKPLLPFMVAPFADGLLHRLADVGCTRATWLVGKDAAPFEPLRGLGEAVDVDVAIVTEPAPLDTAGAARLLLRAGEQAPVLVCNGDILTDLDYGGLLRAHEDAGAQVTIALTIVEDTSAFGVVVCDDDRRVRRFVEKPPGGTEEAHTVNAGTYVLSPDVFDGFPGDGPLSFEREVFPGLLERGQPMLGVAADAYWQDLGTPLRYLSGHRAVLDGRCSWPLPAGLQLRDSSSAVAADADVDPDADLGAGVVVGRGCRIGPGARLADVVVHDGVEIGPEAQLRRTIIGPGSRIGEAAIVGPDAVLADSTDVPPSSRFPSS